MTLPHEFENPLADFGKSDLITCTLLVCASQGLRDATCMIVHYR